MVRALQFPEKLYIFSILVATADCMTSSKVQFHYTRSVQDLKVLAKWDFRVSKYLQRMRNTSNSTELSVALEKYLKDFQETYKCFRMNDTIENYIGDIVKNPIFTYRLIRRFTLHFDQVEKAVNEPLEVTKQFAIQRGSNWRPRYSDLQDALTILIRIQDTYSLNVTEFAQGNLREVRTSAHLSAVHCYEIGNFARRNAQYTVAIEWLREANQLTKTDATIDHGLVHAALIETLSWHDKTLTMSPPNTINMNLFLQPFSTIQNYSQAQKARHVLESEYKGKRGKPEYWKINYLKLCSETKLKPVKESLKLYCWLEHRQHHSYAIMPLKMEFLSQDPDIVLIHEAFTDEETSIMINSSKILQPSVVLNGEELKLHHGRTSIQAFLHSSDSSNISAFNDKISRMTGFEVTADGSSEPLAVVNYAVGNYYGMHFDSLGNGRSDDEGGDRIATILIYLSDLEQGGVTVFPEALTFTVPAKGSAVLWFNVFPSGSNDNASIHAACPVIYGEKWVANKWIRMNSQFIKWKCPLNPKQRFRIPVRSR